MSCNELKGRRGVKSISHLISFSLKRKEKKKERGKEEKREKGEKNMYTHLSFI